MADQIRIRQLDDSTVRAWDDFVNGCGTATFFHRSGWKKIVERAFGHQTHYLYAEEDGDIKGVLPLGHVKSVLFGNALISVPFCVYGGIAASSADASVALDKSACELAESLSVDYLEFRNLRPGDFNRRTKDLYVTFRKELASDPEQNLKAIPRKQRAMVRKGINAGLKSVIDADAERFYNAYAESVRNLGTPVFSKRYIREVSDVFDGECDFLTVEHQGQAIASVMNFYFRDEVLPYYGGGTDQARSLKGNDFMYWEVMRRAVERGIRVFDYGRSKKGTGSYRFKKHWGFDEQPLYYEYHLVKAKQIPDINPLNPKYRAFIEIWKRMPLAISKQVGPWISRSLG